MIDINKGVEKLFKVVQHSVKFDLRNETNNTNSLYEFYLSELKLLEHTLYKKQYE
jgi:hypothetical protein